MRVILKTLAFAFLLLLNNPAFSSVMVDDFVNQQHNFTPTPSNESSEDDRPEKIIKELFEAKIQASYIKDAAVINNRFFRHGEFLLSRQTDEELELEDERNTPEMKSLCSTSISDGRVYDAFNRLADNFHNHDSINDDYRDFNYVVSKNGTLFIMDAENGCHSYILKSKPEDPYYGIGKPVACAGKMSFSQGKITSINIDSGHYWPFEDQLVLVTHHLFKKGIFANDAKVGIRTYTRLPTDFISRYPRCEWEYEIPLQVFLSITPEEILNKYR